MNFKKAICKKKEILEQAQRLKKLLLLWNLGPWNLSSLFDRVLNWYWVKTGRQEGRF